MEKDLLRFNLSPLGIEPKEVRRPDGSVIEGWFTFRYNGIPVFTYMYRGHRTYQVGVPPYPPYADEYDRSITGRFSSTCFNYFIEHIEDFVEGTEGNKRMAEYYVNYMKNQLK